jgi:transposase InsO family protein
MNNQHNVVCNPFIKDDKSTLQTLNMFKVRFEVFCRMIGIDPTNVIRGTQHQANARGMLLLHGGDWILQKCMEHDYMNMSYIQLMEMLENHFKDSNPKFHQIEFIETKPKPNETLKDYISRLKPLARAADMDNEAQYMLRIMQHYQDKEVRDKAIERGMTLQDLIEWQTTRERSEALLGDNGTSSRVNRIHDTRKRYSSASCNNGNYSPQTKIRHYSDSVQASRNNYANYGNSRQRRDTSKPTSSSNADNDEYRCTRCNHKGLHGPEGCYAKVKNLKCHGCGERGHLEICCPDRTDRNDRLFYDSKNKSKSNRGQSYKKVNASRQITSEQPTASSESSSDNSDIDENNQHKRKNNRVKVNVSDNAYKATIRVCGYDTKHVLDSGSDCNLMSRKQFNKLSFKPKLRKSIVEIVDYNKNDIDIIGEFTCYMGVNGMTKAVTYLVVNNDNVDNIIGIKTLRDFNMVKFSVSPNKKSVYQLRSTEAEKQRVLSNLAYWKKKMPELFENRIGCVPNTFISIHTNKNVTPTQQPAYPCALALMDGAYEACQELLQNDIIEELPPNSDISWISPLHVVEKTSLSLNGEKRKLRNDMLDQRRLDKKLIRITSNNKCLNKAIIKQKRLMPNIVQLKKDLAGMKFFSKVDIRSAFNTIMLDDKSRNYTVFSTPWGKLYRYKRLNMGLCIASELYQEKMMSLLADLTNIRVAKDDILVFGRTKEEEFAACEALMKRLKELNLTINEKSVFNVTELEFFGMIINEDGIKPNENKVQALIDMHPPKNPKDLESFLGLANYFHERIIKLATLSEPLKLLKNVKPKDFIWLPIHQQAFENVKQALIQDTLGHFSLDKDTELWVDASPNGVAAFLVQIDPKNPNRRKLIGCKSKSFTKAERNYSQIERECYACVWAVESFHLYLMGQNFKLMTDNKALVHIFENDDKYKSKSRRITMRLQGWRSRLTQYSRMSVHHVKGTTNIADCLSRCLNKRQEIPSIDLRLNINRISTKEIEKAINRVIVEKATISVDKIASETDKDPQLSIIKQYIMHNASISKLDNRYRSIVDEISLSSSGVLLKEDRILIPSSLEQMLIDQAHEACLGISLTTRLLKNKYFWPKMDKMIKDKIETCIACLSCTDTTAPKAIIPSWLPNKKWKLVAIDFSSKTPDGKYILVLIDEYSRYPILEFTNGLTSKAAIQALKAVFKKFGVPENIKSDNGPAFISSEFRQFATEHKFKHIKITPEHPQSNPIAERFMGNINKQIRCSTVLDEDYKQKLLVFLDDYRSTPHSTTAVSPNELFGLTSSRWPSLNNKSESQANEIARLYDEQNKLKIVSYANKYQHVKQPKLKTGDTVLYKEEKTGQIRKSKHAPFLLPTPYKITNMKGSMVTAQTNDHLVVRDVERFRKIRSDVIVKSKRKQSVTTEIPFLSGGWPMNCFAQNFQAVIPQINTPPQTPALPTLILQQNQNAVAAAILANHQAPPVVRVNALAQLIDPNQIPAPQRAARRPRGRPPGRQLHRLQNRNRIAPRQMPYQLRPRKG